MQFHGLVHEVAGAEGGINVIAVLSSVHIRRLNDFLKSFVFRSSFIDKRGLLLIDITITSFSSVRSSKITRNLDELVSSRTTRSSSYRKGD